MKEHIFPAIRFTLLFALLFSGVYTLFIYGFAQLTPNHGEGEMITYNGHQYYANIGQKFSDDKYFYARPSAVDYNAVGSAGSNKSASNPDYLTQVQTRIDTFLAHNPGVKKSDIPADLLTASGSGIDPHISVQAANVQIARIAKVRGIAEANIRQLILSHIEAPWLGLFGPEKINVLKLNIALDKLNK